MAITNGEGSVITMMWDDYGDGWSMHDGYGVGWIVLGVLIILLAVLVGTLVALLVRKPDPTAGPAVPPGAQPREAEEILRRRFALGEIEEDEYLSRRSTLAENAR